MKGKVEINDSMLASIPDCQFKNDMMEMLANGGTLTLSMNAPKEYLDAKKKVKEVAFSNPGISLLAASKCQWWQFLWCKD